MLRSSRPGKLILLSTVVLGIGLLLFGERVLRQIGDFLIIQDPLQPADVIHVIAGEDFRTDYAFQLYKEGYGKMVFFTGGWCDVHLEDHGVRAREKAFLQGLPLDSIASDGSAVMSTYMEAERLKKWIESSPIPVRSIIVVSDPFHMRRARWAYQKSLVAQFESKWRQFLLSLHPANSPGGKIQRARNMLNKNILSSFFICSVTNTVGDFFETGYLLSIKCDSVPANS